LRAGAARECIGSTEVREGETARTAAIRVLKDMAMATRRSHAARCGIRRALGTTFNRRRALGGKALKKHTSPEDANWFGRAAVAQVNLFDVDDTDRGWVGSQAEHPFREMWQPIYIYMC
jgi:hypothetical protein